MAGVENNDVREGRIWWKGVEKKKRGVERGMERRNDTHIPGRAGVIR